VYFRVSEDEFEEFMGLCRREGARSISDLARDAMHKMLTAANGDTARWQFQMLDKLIAEVSAQLRHIGQLQGTEPMYGAAPNASPSSMTSPDNATDGQPIETTDGLPASV
jgi:hypothetical protein